MEDKNKYKIDYAKLTAEQRDKIEQYQMSKKQLNALDDVVTMFSQLFNVLKDNGTNEEIQKLGVLLTDTREQLVSLNKKESPELDNSPVVKAVDNLGKQITKAIDKIDVKPVVTQAPAPQVNVDAPDLSKLEAIVKTLPKAFDSAIKSLHIPEHSNADIVKVMNEVSEKLDSIDTGVRMKPQPGTIKVTNPDGSPVGAAAGGATEAKQDAIITELQQKTEPGDIQNVEMINALRALLQQIAVPSWFDPTTNTLRVGTTAVTVSSGTVTTVTTVGNLTNFGSNAADVMARDTSINTWANVARRTIG